MRVCMCGGVDDVNTQTCVEGDNVLYFVVFTPPPSLPSGTAIAGDKEAVLCSLLLHKKLGERVAVLTDLSTEEHLHLLGSSIQSSTCTISLYLSLTHMHRIP